MTFRSPSGTGHRSLICGAIGFPSCVVRPTAFAEPSRPPRVRPTDFMTIPSPLQPTVTNGNRASLLGASSPIRAALRRFAFARNGHAPMTSTRHSLAGSSACVPFAPPPRWTRFSASAPLSLSVLGSLRQGPRSGFPPPVCWPCRSHPSTPGLRPYARGDRMLDSVCPEPIEGARPDRNRRARRDRTLSCSLVNAYGFDPSPSLTALCPPG